MKTKTHYFSLLFFVVPLLVLAQDYRRQFQNDICGCMEAKASEHKYGTNPTLLFQLCYQEKLPDYVPNIEAEITATEQREIYAEGQKIRKELKESFISELIGTCDFYYQGVETERENTLIGLKSIAENIHYIDMVNQAVAMQPTAGNYIKRGQVYFGQENYMKAKADFQKASEINEHDSGAKLMLAWAHEKTQNYTAAMRILKALNEKQPGQNFEVLIQIVNRKMGGKGTIRLPSEVPSIKKGENKKEVTKGEKKKDDLKKLFKLDN